MIIFEWDPEKARANHRKHGVPFEEARTVFLDENAFQFIDPDHSPREMRYLMLGMSQKGRVLLVSHCERDDGRCIRIISARKATAGEREHYPWWKR